MHCEPKRCAAFGDQGGVLDRRGVDGNLVRAVFQDEPHVIDRPDAAAHREGNVHLFRHALDHVEDDVPPVGRGGDVQEDELVGALVVVKRAVFDGIARVDKIDEVDSLDDAALVNVKAGDDSFGQHGYMPPLSCIESE